MAAARPLIGRSPRLPSAATGTASSRAGDVSCFPSDLRIGAADHASANFSFFLVGRCHLVAEESEFSFGENFCQLIQVVAAADYVDRKPLAHDGTTVQRSRPVKWKGWTTEGERDSTALLLAKNGKDRRQLVVKVLRILVAMESICCEKWPLCWPWRRTLLRRWSSEEMSSGKCSPSRPDDDRLPAPSYDHLAFEWDCCWAAQGNELLLGIMSVHTPDYFLRSKAIVGQWNNNRKKDARSMRILQEKKQNIS